MEQFQKLCDRQMITALSDVSKDLVFLFQLEGFINDNNEDLGSAAQSGRNAVEAAKADLLWTSTHKDVIIAWLRAQVSPGGTTDGSGNIATNIIIITAAFLVALCT
jgi:hypothetical protein